MPKHSCFFPKHSCFGMVLMETGRRATTENDCHAIGEGKQETINNNLRLKPRQNTGHGHSRKLGKLLWGGLEIRLVHQNLEEEKNTSVLFEMVMGFDPEPQEERFSVLRKIVF